VVSGISIEIQPDSPRTSNLPEAVCDWFRNATLPDLAMFLFEDARYEMISGESVEPNSPCFDSIVSEILCEQLRNSSSPSLNNGAIYRIRNFTHRANVPSEKPQQPSRKEAEYDRG
jgi:hypothetical protein